MKPRAPWSSLRSLPVLAAVVLALLVGSIGTAAAGGLTKKTVRHVAAKVVKKKAAKLSVRSASTAVTAVSAQTAVTAGNAQALAGRPDTAYLERRQVFTAAVATASHGVSVDIPVTGPGTFEVSYNAFLSASATTNSECFMARRENGADAGLVADSGGTAIAQQAGRSGTSVISLGAGQTLQLRCTSSAVFTTRADQPIQVIVQPLDIVVAAAVTPTLTP